MSSSAHEAESLSGAIIPVVTTPSSVQIVVDLTCALVTNGMFRFRTLDSQARLDELLQFIAANAAQIPSSIRNCVDNPAQLRVPQST